MQKEIDLLLWQDCKCTAICGPSTFSKWLWVQAVDRQQLKGTYKSKFKVISPQFLQILMCWGIPAGNSRPCTTATDLYLSCILGILLYCPEKHHHRSWFICTGGGSFVFLCKLQNYYYFWHLRGFFVTKTTFSHPLSPPYLAFWHTKWNQFINHWVPTYLCSFFFCFFIYILTFNVPSNMPSDGIYDPSNQEGAYIVTSCYYRWQVCTRKNVPNKKNQGVEGLCINREHKGEKE